MNFLAKLSKVLATYTAVFVFGAAVIAFINPPLFTWISGNTQTSILGFIMLSMGMTLSSRDLKILATRPLDIFIGAAAQYTLMPLLAITLVHLFNLPKGVAVGLLLVGTCPGGVSSNIMSYLAKGDVAFSVGMTTASTLLSPVVTPISMLWISGEIIDINAFAMFKGILIVTLIPITIGSLLNFSFGEKSFYKKLVVAMPTMSVLGLACIVGGVTAFHGARFLESGFAILFAIIAHNTLGYLTGYGVGILTNMNNAKRRTISIEVGCQNAGLATNLASTYFQALPDAAVASAVACVYHSFSGTVLANIFAIYDKINNRKKHCDDNEELTPTHNASI